MYWVVSNLVSGISPTPSEISKNRQMKASGCTVTTLTSAEKAAFKKVTEPIWKTASDKVGPKMMELLQSELKKVNR